MIVVSLPCGENHSGGNASVYLPISSMERGIFSESPDFQAAFVVCKHPARYSLAAEGVGSGVFNLFNFRQILNLLECRFPFR